MKETLEYIVRFAGVSRSTVIWAMHHYPLVNEPLRQQVLAIIQKQNLYPNAAVHVSRCRRLQIRPSISPTTSQTSIIHSRASRRVLAWLRFQPARLVQANRISYSDLPRYARYDRSCGLPVIV